MPSVVLAVTGLKREAGLIRGEGVVPVVSGGQVDALQNRLDLALVGHGVVGLISIGIAGALSPTVALADWVVATAVVHGSTRWLTDAAWTEGLLAAGGGGRLHAGLIAASDTMVTATTDKTALFSTTGALAVDMESHVAARFAQTHGLPFAAVRVVSDAADRTLPPAVQVGMRADGGMNLPAVLWALAKAPGQFPALIRTGREADIAFKALLGCHDLFGRPGIGCPYLR